MESRYRACVLAVFTNEDGEVLVGERNDRRGQWQFPQGGVDPGEDALEALFREMEEEIGCRDFTVVRCAAHRVRYDFPKNFEVEIAKRYRGQEQVWYHVQFLKDAGPDLSKATHAEFVAMRWVTALEALRLVVDFKRDAYREGLTQLGLLS